MRISLAHLLIKSPLPHIVHLMDQVTQTANRVPELIDLLIANDHLALERVAREVSVLEALADEAKNQFRSKMPVRLMLPVDRRDVLQLISQIDSIADCAEDVGVLLTLRKFEVPSTLTEPLVDFVTDVMTVVQAASQLVAMTDQLTYAGFRGQVAQEVLKQASKLGQLEHQADKRQDQCAKILFRSEGELSAVAIFMWTKVLNKIGDIANCAENIGDQFRLFVAT